jgi:hypothetical protein
MVCFARRQGAWRLPPEAGSQPPGPQRDWPDCRLGLLRYAAESVGVYTVVSEGSVKGSCPRRVAPACVWSALDPLLQGRSRVSDRRDRVRNSGHQHERNVGGACGDRLSTRTTSPGPPATSAASSEPPRPCPTRTAFAQGGHASPTHRTGRKTGHSNEWTNRLFACGPIQRGLPSVVCRPRRRSLSTPRHSRPHAEPSHWTA